LSAHHFHAAIEAQPAARCNKYLRLKMSQNCLAGFEICNLFGWVLSTGGNEENEEQRTSFPLFASVQSAFVGAGQMLSNRFGDLGRQDVDRAKETCLRAIQQAPQDWRKKAKTGVAR